MRLAVLLVIGAAACGDDLSITVDVTHPLPVKQTVISVYESDDVNCTKVEFGDLDAATLAATLVAEEVHDENGKLVSGSLDGVSRTKDKTIVARGFDENGGLIAGGCQTKGVVHGHDHVPISTDHAMIISATVSDDDPYTINVLATKTDGTFLNKREVSWQVYAPIGSLALKEPLATYVGPKENAEWQPPAAACTGVGGGAKIHPVPPSQIGGFATRIRASWAANTLPFETALLKADPAGLFQLKPPPGVRHVCAVKIANGGTTQRLICLDTETGNPVAKELQLTVGMGRGTFALASAPVSLTAPIGLVSKPRVGSTTDRDVYAIDSTGAQIPLFGARAPSANTFCMLQPLTPCAGFTDFLYAPACSAPDDKPRMIFQSANELRFMPADGGLAVTAVDTAGSTVTLRRAGCVSQVSALANKLVRQVVVADTTGTGDTVTIGVYGCEGGTCNKVQLPVASSDVGFVETMTGENRLVGPSIDATGLVMSSWVIRATQSTDHADLLLERDRVPAAFPPNRIVVAKLDDDDGYDLLWTNPMGRATTIDIAYSRMAEQQRLEVVSPLTAISASDLLLDDLDNDGHPELILYGTTVLGGVTVTGVAAVPTHVAPAPTMTMAEDPCTKM